MSLKITPAELEQLRSRITPHDTEFRREQYRTGKFFNSHRTRDLDKRYRWDLFWTVRTELNLTSDLKDSHIDSALRAIVPAISMCPK